MRPRATHVRQQTVAAEAITAYAEIVAPARAHEVATRPAAEPLFAATLATECFAEALAPALASPELVGLVHVRHEMEIFRVLRVGDQTETSAALVGARRALGGALLDVSIETRVGGGCVAAATATVLAIGYEADEEFGARRRRPESGKERPARRSAFVIARNDAQRYAAVSGDVNPIHFDRAAARRAGFDDVVVHGMCVLGHVTTALSNLMAGGNSARITRIAARFVNAVFPGNRLEISVRPIRAPQFTHSFVVERSDGTVIVRGWTNITGPSCEEVERDDHGNRIA